MKSAFAMRMLLMCGLLQGCVINSQPRPNDPYYAPVMAPTPVPVAAANGSLYNAGTDMHLFADRRASRVGDILTVVLQENTTSRKSSNVEVNKDSTTSVAEGTALGNAVRFKGLGLDASLSAEREFTGEAGAAQSNNLRGDVAVSVVDVWPNGTLVVRGEKWITLNRGEEFIRISGLVRPEDVRQDNTVLSNKVANARITYAGTGALADSQTMGWLSRFFNSAYWPF